jgi:hypothetical protein
MMFFGLCARILPCLNGILDFEIFLSGVLKSLWMAYNQETKELLNGEVYGAEFVKQIQTPLRILSKHALKAIEW